MCSSNRSIGSNSGGDGSAVVVDMNGRYGSSIRGSSTIVAAAAAVISQWYQYKITEVFTQFIRALWFPW